MNLFVVDNKNFPETLIHSLHHATSVGLKLTKFLMIFALIYKNLKFLACFLTAALLFAVTCQLLFESRVILFTLGHVLCYVITLYFIRQTRLANSKSPVLHLAINPHVSA